MQNNCIINQKLMKKISYGKQYISEQDINAVVEVLKSENLTMGPAVPAFEEAFAKYIGSKYAVAVSNGTAALHLSVLALGVKKGDRVITTPITFAASANCVRYCEGEVIFNDIDPGTYLLDVVKLRKLLASKPKGYFKGIIPVDFAGRAVNLEEIKILAEEFGLWIIEDACHAPGGYFIDNNEQKQNCGNCVYTNLAIFSFHPVKHIACGEGGMITTNDKKLYKQLLRLRSHGITKEDDGYINDLNFANASEGQLTYPGWYMEMQQLGFNYRITDFQAALGKSQLKRADTGLAKRKEIALKYKNIFNNAHFINGQSGIIEGHAYHLYIIEVKDRLGLYNYLRLNNIFAQIHYIPCHLMPYYKAFGWKEGDMPNAENYYKNCISLPIYPTLTDEEQQFVIDKIFTFYNG